LFIFDCLIYQGYGQPTGYDRTRNVEIGRKDVKLKHMEEAFTSDHWLVRIYKYLLTFLCVAEVHAVV